MLAAVRNGAIAAVGSWELAEELASVVGRPKLRRYEISEEDVRDLLVLLARDLPDVDVTPELRDPRDAPVVAAAIAGHAEAIITGDRDLLEDDDLGAWLSERGVKLMTPAEALESV